MFKGKELIYILIAIIISAFVIALPIINLQTILLSLLYALIIILVFVLGQKVFALFLDCKANIDLWELKRFGFKKSQKMKTGFPLWLLIPILLGLISNGAIKWVALLNYEVVPIIHRRSKRRYAELTERDVALIGAGGPLFILAFSFIVFLIGFKDLSMLGLWLSFFSLLPVGKTTGTKIFFGQKFLWILLIVFTLLLLIFFHFVASIALAVLVTIFAAILAILGTAVALFFLKK